MLGHGIEWYGRHGGGQKFPTISLEINFSFLFNWEAYLNQEWFDAVDLVNFQTILLSKDVEFNEKLLDIKKNKHLLCSFVIFDKKP